MLHFLQREPWAVLQKHQGRSSVSDAGAGWSYQAFIERGRLGTRLYAPYGPFISAKDTKEATTALAEALDSLKQNAKKHGVDYVRLEPTGNVTGDQLTTLGLNKVRTKQPEHTQIIDVDRPFAEVLQDMRKTLRNLHRNYAKKGLSVRVSRDPKDVEHLLRLMAEVSGRNGMLPHSDDYLRANAEILMPLNASLMYLAELEGQVVAAALTFEDADCRYYAHAAADTAHRNLHPGTILVTQMIEDATLSEQKYFDLFGVVDKDAKDHPWFGFSEFKRTFGGYQHDTIGTWELPIKKTKYLAFKLANKLVKD